jgi:hypothetical protein
MLPQHWLLIVIVLALGFWIGRNYPGLLPVTPVG